MRVGIFCWGALYSLWGIGAAAGTSHKDRTRVHGILADRVGFCKLSGAFFHPDFELSLWDGRTLGVECKGNPKILWC